MEGYTENRIVIFRDFDHVFQLTNRIDLWPKLFSEYQSAEILKKEENTIQFRLVTFPDEGRPSRSWVSTRVIMPEERRAIADREENSFPFTKMHIEWEYEELPNKDGVILTWMQSFIVHADCQFSAVQMESFLNRNTRSQMKLVKTNVEQWHEPF